MSTNPDAVERVAEALANAPSKRETETFGQYDRRRARAILDALPELAQAQAAVERVTALADEWTSATCQTDGAPCSWHRVAACAASDLRAALAGTEPTDPEQEV